MSASIQRLLGLVLLVIGFFLTLSTIVGLGNGLGPIEGVVMFLGCTLLICLGWWLRDPRRLSDPTG
jgi:hypothetical protein